MRKDDSDRVLATLRATPVFRRLSTRRLNQLLAASRLERYVPGQIIVRQGTLGDAFYVVIHGRVAVQTSHAPGESSQIATLGPGQYFGELALLSARPRTADVLADGEAEVLAVPGAAFATYLLSDAWFKAHLVEQSQERENELLRQRVAHTLQNVPLFAGLRWEELLHIGATGRVAEVPAGTVICRQGETTSAAYVVLEGELALRVQSGDDERLVAMLGPGASLGEVALLHDEPMAASATAVRNSRLLVLDQAQFQALMDRAPLARRIGQALSDRLRAEAPRPLYPATGGGTVIVVVGEAIGLGATTLAVNLAASLAQEVGPIALLDPSPDAAASQYAGVTAPRPARRRGAVPKNLPQAAPGIAVLAAPFGEGGRHFEAVRGALQTLRQRYPFVVVDGGDDPDDLARGLLGPTDALVLLTRGRARPTTLQFDGPHPEVLVAYPPSRELQPAVVEVADHVFHLPANPQAIERFHPGGRPFVVSEPHSFLSRAVGRIARYLTRQQVGLVLSGGASLAPTHAGVLAGLEELGTDIDLLVGTGIGSLLAAAYAIGLPIQSLERLGVAFQSPLEDLMGPRTPRRADVARGRRLRHLVRSLFGSTPLESLQIPLWVVALDADTGEEVVLRSGPLADALEAGLGLHQAPRGGARRRRRLLDSSVVNPVPVGLAREMGADVVVAVAPAVQAGAALLEARRAPVIGRGRGPLRLAMETLRLAALRLTASSVGSADVVITLPARGGSGHARFQQGRLAAMQAAPRVAALQAARLRQPVAH